MVNEQFRTATMASTLTFKQLHPTFGVEISGADFSSSTDQLLLEQFKRAVAKVGFHVPSGADQARFRDLELTGDNILVWRMHLSSD